ncbi:hypothetical protein [Salinisphaera sp. G21_0]|uniref:hypothetical protein n=1 Tax=Salinisphaera sp. G21_0 TaxID=2821094 RepID=UPI001ADA9271|nr:hypothetical protein [Salinisphaera sp. G21_0]MBO9484588.1 hypothetical protein [Salinisphaera sp. G21_0]
MRLCRIIITWCSISQQAKKRDTKEVLQRWTQLFYCPHLVQRYLAGDQPGKAELLRVEKYAQQYRVSGDLYPT